MLKRTFLSVLVVVGATVLWFYSVALVKLLEEAVLSVEVQADQSSLLLTFGLIFGAAYVILGWRLIDGIFNGISHAKQVAKLEQEKKDSEALYRQREEGLRAQINQLEWANRTQRSTIGMTEDYHRIHRRDYEYR
jgi:hypothetical protein